MYYTSRAHSGFSLVELSIVLVILGLLTGGILGGQALIKAAEMRAVTTEYQTWQTAVNTFRNKYFALPGDMRNATQFWTTGTWSGNGDGTLQYAAGANQNGENLTFWQHLALAGLINGEFTGQAGPGSNEDSLAGTNVPGSKYGSGGWTTEHIVWNASAGSVGWYNVNYGNFYQFGGKYTNYEYGDGILTPEEAWNIDTKIDDGIPSRGKLVARHWDSCGQAASGTTSATNLDAVYVLSATSAECALAFLQL
jgi:prepilin-type N-terminal cleavage/methylation domain-containing protein